MSKIVASPSQLLILMTYAHIHIYSRWEGVFPTTTHLPSFGGPSCPPIPHTLHKFKHKTKNSLFFIHVLEGHVNGLVCDECVCGVFRELTGADGVSKATRGEDGGACVVVPTPIQFLISAGQSLIHVLSYFLLMGLHLRTSPSGRKSRAGEEQETPNWEPSWRVQFKL